MNKPTILTHNINKFPQGFKYCDDYSLSEFTNYEILEAEQAGAEEIWYWYAEADYEGVGLILIRQGNLYDLHDAGHCSCYSPTERIDFHGKTKEELGSTCSKELLKEAIDLFEAAGIVTKTKGE